MASPSELLAKSIRSGVEIGVWNLYSEPEVVLQSIQIEIGGEPGDLAGS